MNDGMDDTLLETDLTEAHLPALLVALVQLTGDISLLRQEWRPQYAPYSDGRSGGLSETEQAKIRKLAFRLLQNRNASAADLSSRPDPHLLKALMQFVAGAEIPERYIPLLEEELGLGPRLSEASVFGEKQAGKNASDVKVMVIGAGMSGLLAGIKLKQAGYSFEIIERHGDIGGTWFENTYPGCRVDSQNHIYSYSFAPDYDLPAHYSTQPVLLEYFRKTAESHELADHIRLRTNVEKAEYDEDSASWIVHLRKPDASVEIARANVIISAVGQLNMPKIPEIEGSSSFGGYQFHSARWNHSVDLEGKRVAVIGTGASAFQFIPPLARQASHLAIFQRSAPWVAPTPDYHFEVGRGQKWLFKNMPFYANWYRFWLFWSITDGMMGALKIDPTWRADDSSISEANQKIRKALIDKMKEQVGDHPELLAKVIPDYVFGGKRTLRDNGQWIKTLLRDNVDLITTGIKNIVPEGIVTSDGTIHPADVIIYGTGFHASKFLEPMKIVGRSGIELTSRWAGEARAYLGMTVPEYPNFFCIYGPNTNLVAQGSIVFFSECSMRYILGCLKLMTDLGGRSMEPRQEIHDEYNARIDAANAEMAWGMPGVSSWYKSQSGRVSQNWPLPLFDYWDATRVPNPSDFNFHK